MLTKVVKKDRGFTLIELLVVISIISMLSSVVFASLQGAKKKARIIAKNSSERSLELALQLYYQDHGAYPLNPANVVPGTPATYSACLEDETCGGGVGGFFTPDPVFLSQLSPYISTASFNFPPVPIFGGNSPYVGFVYTCNLDPSTTTCQSPVITYVQDGNTTDSYICAHKTTVITAGGFGSRTPVYCMMILGGN